LVRDSVASVDLVRRSLSVTILESGGRL